MQGARIRIVSPLTRIFHESLAATTDMAVLPGVLGCSFGFAQDRLTLGRTFQVRLGTNPAVPRDGCPARGASACAALRSVPHRKRHLRQAGSHLRGLATAIHEIPGLALCCDPFLFLFGLKFINVSILDRNRLQSLLVGQSSQDRWGEPYTTQCDLACLLHQ